MAQSSSMQTAKRELKEELANLAELRDELRLKLHLAGMDAKSAWQSMEQKLALLEEKLGYEGDHVVQETRELVVDVRESLIDLKRRYGSRAL